MISSWLAALSYRRFLSACRTPLPAQAACLRRILHQAAVREIGRRSGFAELSRIADPVALIREYQTRLPIQSYRQMKPELDAVYAGNWRKLCPSRPRFFAMTAGSTGHFKHIPVTREFRRELGQGSLIYYGALEASCPALRRLKSQFLAGSAEGGVSPDGIPQGFASGFNYKNLPRLIRGKFVLPYWIFTLADAEERSYAAGRILVEQRGLGLLSAISPVNLINLRVSLERGAEQLFADLAAGTLTVRSRASIAGVYRGRPDPRLAETLRAAWQRDGRLPDRVLFPSLRVLACWQGGNMSYYLKQLDACFGPKQHFEFPISASEGIFAIPSQPNQAGGILAVTSHFLEFLPAEPTEPRSGPALRADQLEVGGHYGLVVTTSGGLYRYDMEDIVRVRSFYRATPVIEFVSKRDRQISVANERLTELDVTLAMQAAGETCGIWFPEFLFVPCRDKRYRVLVDGGGLELESKHRMAAFAGELERQLRKAARGYDFERDDALLEPLQLALTAPGELREYLRGRQSPSELPNAQIKPMHLTNEFNAHERFRLERSYAA